MAAASHPRKAAGRGAGIPLLTNRVSQLTRRSHSHPETLGRLLARPFPAHRCVGIAPPPSLGCFGAGGCSVTNFFFFFARLGKPLRCYGVFPTAVPTRRQEAVSFPLPEDSSEPGGKCWVL